MYWLSRQEIRMQAFFGNIDVLARYFRAQPLPAEQMGDLCRSPTAHKTVVNNISGIGPGRDLVVNQLLGKDRWVLKRYLVARARCPDIVIENVVDLALRRGDVVVGKVVAAH